MGLRLITKWCEWNLFKWLAFSLNPQIIIRPSGESRDTYTQTFAEYIQSTGKTDRESGSLGPHKTNKVHYLSSVVGESCSRDWWQGWLGFVVRLAWRRSGPAPAAVCTPSRGCSSGGCMATTSLSFSVVSRIAYLVCVMLWRRLNWPCARARAGALWLPSRSAFCLPLLTPLNLVKCGARVSLRCEDNGSAKRLSRQATALAPTPLPSLSQNHRALYRRLSLFGCEPRLVLYTNTQGEAPKQR